VQERSALQVASGVGRPSSLLTQGSAEVFSSSSLVDVHRHRSETTSTPVPQACALVWLGAGIHTIEMKTWVDRTVILTPQFTMQWQSPSIDYEALGGSSWQRWPVAKANNDGSFSQRQFVNAGFEAGIATDTSVTESSGSLFGWQVPGSATFGGEDDAVRRVRVGSPEVPVGKYGIGASGQYVAELLPGGVIEEKVLENAPNGNYMLSFRYRADGKGQPELEVNCGATIETVTLKKSWKFKQYTVTFERGSLHHASTVSIKAQNTNELNVFIDDVTIQKVW